MIACFPPVSKWQRVYNPLPACIVDTLVSVNSDRCTSVYNPLPACIVDMLTD